METPVPPPRGSLREIAAVFTRLGFTAFGGPAAHVAMMEDELVNRRKWLDRQHFLDLVAAINFIPGPNSTELAIHLGLIRGGFRGLVVAGFCFITPAVLIILPIAWLYVRYAGAGVTPPPAVLGALQAIAGVVVAILAITAWRFAHTVARTPVAIAVALLTLPADPLLRRYTDLQSEIVILAAAALVGAITARRKPPGDGDRPSVPAPDPPSRPQGQTQSPTLSPRTTFWVPWAAVLRCPWRRLIAAARPRAGEYASPWHPSESCSEEEPSDAAEKRTRGMSPQPYRRGVVPAMFPVGLVPMLSAAIPAEFLKLAWYFLTVGGTLFGSGYVLVNYLETGLVQQHGWLTHRQVADAVAVGQVTPGPLLTTATFAGYLRGHAITGTELGGVAGAVVATVAIFLPAFVLVALTGRVLQKLRRSRRARGALDAMNAAVVMLLVIVTARFGVKALVGADGLLPVPLVATVVSLVAIRTARVPTSWAIVIAGVAGALVAHLGGR